MANEIPERPKRPDDNPWYRLATLYGQPPNPGHDLEVKNRMAWNRYMSAEIEDDLRTNLIKTERYSAEELTPFSQDELREIQTAYEDRSGTSTEIPEIPETIDFSNIGFDRPFFAQCFVFPKRITFDSAIFSDRAHFGNATFVNSADFSSATFSRYTNFGIATFSDTTFRNATFSDFARFSSAKFSGIADFRSATFSYVSPLQKPPMEDADFDRATFSGFARFSSATFAGTANFRSARFLAGQTLSRYNIAEFRSATFSGPAYFSNATFSGVADFSSKGANSKTTFSDLADFGSATFSDRADFSRATFSGLARFQRATFRQETLFVDAKMESQTSFDDVTFFQPPQFFGAMLHEGTRWHGAKWPEPPRDTATARNHVDAYERLKSEMDRLKKHEDELNFFAHELQCREVLLGWRGIISRLYGILCGHGRYYMRPLGILVIIGIAGAVPIRAHFSGWSPATFFDHGFGCRAFGLSFANTLGLFGFSKDLIDVDVLHSLPGWLKVVSACQTVCGIGLLFLFGLSIRNRFRMR